MEEFNKLKKLKEALAPLDMHVDGLENYPLDYEGPIIAFANHGHLMDIFYLAASVPKEHVTIMSNRLTYKNIPERKQMIYDYLNPLPLEGTLGTYASISLNVASNLLCEGINLGIFPEGVLNDGTCVVKGRTGIIRALFAARQKGVKPLLLPVAIDVNTQDPNLDRYGFNYSDKVNVRILDRIEYESAFAEFLKLHDPEEENELYHSILDRGMKAIADALQVPFTGSYGFFYPKNNIMLQDGSTICLEEANNHTNINFYEQGIEDAKEELIAYFKGRNTGGEMTGNCEGYLTNTDVSEIYNNEATNGEGPLNITTANEESEMCQDKNYARKLKRHD